MESYRHLYTMAAKKQIETVALPIKAKGDKFLYYKRRVQMFEQTIKVFPFWNNSFVWIFISFSVATIYFILFLVDKSYSQFAQTVHILLFSEQTPLLDKVYIYGFVFFPLIGFLLSLCISYNVFNRRKEAALTIMATNIICTLLFLVAFIKLIQMHYALF